MKHCLTYGNLSYLWHAMDVQVLLHFLAWLCNDSLWKLREFLLQLRQHRIQCSLPLIVHRTSCYQLYRLSMQYASETIVNLEHPLFHLLVHNFTTSIPVRSTAAANSNPQLAKGQNSGAAKCLEKFCSPGSHSYLCTRWFNH